MHREQQISEIEAVRATYPEAGAVVIDGDDPLVPEARGGLNSAQAGLDSMYDSLSGRVLLLDNRIQGRPIGITFKLPQDYPDAAPVVQVICEGGRLIHDELTEAVQEVIKQCSGSEALLLVLQSLQEKHEEMRHSESLNNDESKAGCSCSSQRPAGDNLEPLSRKSIWFHHIKSTTKRKNIVAWARELGVRGFCKPGFPGIIVCEGGHEDVEEYFARIKALTWQAVAVRAEETGEPRSSEGQCWHFQGTFRELEETDMDVLAAECKVVALEHLFRAALKLPEKE